MKIIFFLLALQLYVDDLNCNDAILSKFHQHGYKLRDVRSELSNYSEKYYHFLKITTFKFNRTTVALNLTSLMKVDVQDKMEILVQAKKFLSNEYRHFPMRFQVNLKKCFDSNVMGMRRNLKKCGNVSDIFFHKDIIYHVCNFVIDDTHLPPLFPTGSYKIEITLLYLNDEIASGAAYAEVYTPTVYPKH